MPRELVSIIEGCWHPTPSKRPTFAALKVTFYSEPATLRLALLRASKLLCVCIYLATVRCRTERYRRAASVRRTLAWRAGMAYQQPHPVVYGGHQLGW